MRKLKLRGEERLQLVTQSSRGLRTFNPEPTSYSTRSILFPFHCSVISGDTFSFHLFFFCRSKTSLPSVSSVLLKYRSQESRLFQNHLQPLPDSAAPATNPSLTPTFFPFPEHFMAVQASEPLVILFPLPQLFLLFLCQKSSSKPNSVVTSSDK